MSTLRMEPQFMIIGQAAATAAWAALGAGTSVQRINAAVLHAALIEDGAILDTGLGVWRG